MISFFNKFIAQIKLFFSILSEFRNKNKLKAAIAELKFKLFNHPISCGKVACLDNLRGQESKLSAQVKKYFMLLFTGKINSDEVRQRPEGILGVSINANSIILVHILYDKKIVIKSQQIVAQKINDLSFQDPEEYEIIKNVITAYIKSNNLTGIIAAYVLPSSQYIISLVELSQNPKNTRDKEIFWSVKDYINYSIDDAVLDSFDIPINRLQDNVKLAYAVVTRARLSQDISKLLNACGAYLQYIDIHELSVRNIIALSDELKQIGCLILKIFDNYSSIFLIKDNSLFISRTTKLNIKTLDNFDPINDDSVEKFQIAEGLLLELQRSLDYANNMFRGLNFNKILIIPSSINLVKIIDWLKEQSGLPILQIDLTKLLQSEQLVEIDNYGDIALALGAALRNYDFTGSVHVAAS